MQKDLSKGTILDSREKVLRSPVRLLFPIPDADFDPTEIAVPFQILRSQGFLIDISTPEGRPGDADPRMLYGTELGLWKPLLQANICARQAYEILKLSPEFQRPISWADCSQKSYDGIVLVGGHAKGMRAYLESRLLQNLVSDFFQSQKLVAAICHGVVLAARTPVVARNEAAPQSAGVQSAGPYKLPSQSILQGRRVTALLKSQEMSAWLITALWLKDYYRTYPESVESEVRRALGPQGEFVAGPLPVFRDSPTNLSRGFTVCDQNLITARWPGDAHQFAKAIANYFINSPNPNSPNL